MRSWVFHLRIHRKNGVLQQMKIARASKEIIVVRYYPFPKMLPSIHHRLPFLDLNLRDFAPQATSSVADFPHAIIFSAQHSSLRQRIKGDFVRLFEDEDFRVTRVGDRR